ncbi:hypothetical protein VIMS_01419 [Mycobacterium marinum]|nr:hypothetical protein VIMS_01419 [Mycobacterium marinum]
MLDIDALAWNPATGNVTAAVVAIAQPAQGEPREEDHGHDQHDTGDPPDVGLIMSYCTT